MGIGEGFIVLGFFCMVFLGFFISDMLNRKTKEREIELKHEAKLKAIEALKSNVELKLNSSDLKDFFK